MFRVGLAEALNDEGWLKMLKLNDYPPRKRRRPQMLQRVVFAYTDAVQASVSRASASSLIQSCIADSVSR